MGTSTPKVRKLRRAKDYTLLKNHPGWWGLCRYEFHGAYLRFIQIEKTIINASRVCPDATHFNGKPQQGCYEDYMLVREFPCSMSDMIEHHWRELPEEVNE